MSSRKPSAKAKQIAAFKAQSGGLDDLFTREEQHREDLAAKRGEALYHKACASKNRYTTRAEAEETIRLCEAHGTRGLHCYKCDYCGGWHLTSKPQRR
ncbi:hypothetical protein [Collinsella tanakaei]|uniref:hypothetical protein n=1 Tax=Collinsella tanakaei TaxID=626935 RepID=UPI0025A41F52|nr:hypothetical protein [Collinsella tanakaei]MDM8300900.1 hypothetical protein [Collinsella tanakaei]